MLYVTSPRSQRPDKVVWLLVLLVGWVLWAQPGHAGQIYRWVDEHGQVTLSDTAPPSRRNLQDLKVYEPRNFSPPSEPSDIPTVETSATKSTSTTPSGAVVVEAVLNGHLTVPLMLDTGADMTVLTKHVAEDLRLLSLERLPRAQFRTAGGLVDLPVSSLRSLRVGTAEARDVNIAIDTDGHMPIGLLGMSFLRHFKVTVDQQHGRVIFER